MASTSDELDWHKVLSPDVLPEGRVTSATCAHLTLCWWRGDRLREFCGSRSRTLCTVRQFSPRASTVCFIKTTPYCARQSLGEEDAMR